LKRTSFICSISLFGRIVKNVILWYNLWLLRRYSNLEMSFVNTHERVQYRDHQMLQKSHKFWFVVCFDQLWEYHLLCIYIPIFIVNIRVKIWFGLVWFGSNISYHPKPERRNHCLMIAYMLWQSQSDNGVDRIQVHIVLVHLIRFVVWHDKRYIFHRQSAITFLMKLELWMKNNFKAAILFVNLLW
jgi:hypothetical protein